MTIRRLSTCLTIKAPSRSLIRRTFHVSSRRHAISQFKMPAMSPTMTEGGIASWKLKEGESFAAGDVLLEIETDKATIDVEAPDDGIMGKILVNDGAKAVQVGKVIALLTQEGDDISNIQVPEETSDSPIKEDKAKVETASKSEEAKPTDSGASPSPASQSPPSTPRPAQTHTTHDLKHSRPLFPSVMRLLLENDIMDADKIKGTGKRGMLTKGDVLAHLGKISNPFGTWKKSAKNPDQLKVEGKKGTTPPTPAPLDGAAIRRLVAEGLTSLSKPTLPQLGATPSFASVIEDYLGSQIPTVPSLTVLPVGLPAPAGRQSTDYLTGLY